jgi:hypothetical protein
VDGMGLELQDLGLVHLSWTFVDTTHSNRCAAFKAFSLSTVDSLLIIAEYVKESKGQLKMGNLPGTVQALVPHMKFWSFRFRSNFRKKASISITLAYFCTSLFHHCFDDFHT